MTSDPKLVKELDEAKETIRQQAEIIAKLDKLVCAVCNGKDFNAGVAFISAAATESLGDGDNWSWLYLSNIVDALIDLDMEKA